MTNIANTDQYATWNGESGQRWIADADRRDHVMAPVAHGLLDAARLVPGERVLDIGRGDTSLAAARAVAPMGEVHGVDLSAPMLEVAAQRDKAAGLANMRFEQGDARRPSSCHAALSTSPSAGSAPCSSPIPAPPFANRRPGPAARRPWHRHLATPRSERLLAIAGMALLRYGSMPYATGPGMFSQSDPSVLTATLDAAGFTSVDVTPVAAVLHLATDPEEATDYPTGTGAGEPYSAPWPK
jgi:SAM-dependent methyltransferase